MFKPYVFYREENKYVMQYASDSGQITKVIGQFADILVILLNHIMFWDPLSDNSTAELPWTSNERISIYHYINDIFLNKDDCFGESLPMRYAGYSAINQTIQNINCGTEYYMDELYFSKLAHDAGTSLTAMMEEIQNKYSPMTVIDAYNNAIIKLANTNNIKIYAEKQYYFNSTFDLFLWLIKASAQENQKIEICPICNRYFHKQKYGACSNCISLYTKAYTKDYNEIRSIYLRTHRLFLAKESEFKKNSIPYNIVFAEKKVPCRIVKLKQDFGTKYADYMESFMDAYKSLLKDPTRENEILYKRSKNNILGWLNGKHKFAKLLRQDIDSYI